MMKRRRILHADKIIYNVTQVFCLLMFLQLKDCFTVASNPILLYSTSSDIRVTNLSKPPNTTAIVKGLAQGSAVDFLYKRDLVCYSDQTAELIQCMFYNETNIGEKMRIVTEVTPTGIAIDWYTNKLYWTDGETNRIEVISIDQKHRKILFWSEVDLARAISVVPKEGLMFWTDWGEVPKIERGGMNGDPSTRKIIVKDNIIWPNGITIDYSTNIIYWVDAKLTFIDMMDFDGQNRKRIVNDLVYPYALAFFSDQLYWTDWKTWAIHMWDIPAKGPIKELLVSNHSELIPVDIKVYDEGRQVMPTGDFPCKYNNGGCSHLCLLAPGEPGYVCACPTGLKLKESSNTTCYDSPQTMLLVAQRSIISMISLDSLDYTPYTIPVKDLKRAISVDFDPKTEFFYWADSAAKTISRARLDGSSQWVVAAGGADSLALDPLARTLYWTDPVADTICVARLDGSSKKVLIHDDLYDPRAIALHPNAGLMFWSDWNEKKPKIERASLDGTSRILLVSENLLWPNGLALDMVNNKLYWGDARTHKIEVCNLDGSDRRELHSNDILHIFGVTLLGDRLYWTDMQRRTLDRINKDTGLEREPVVEQMANMLGLKAFARGSNAMGTGNNPCAKDGGGCSHLCFNRPSDYVCSCPLGLELGADKKTCIEPEAFLVYSQGKNVIGRISIENENNNEILPIKDIKEVSALAVHVAGSKIYWADSKTKSIHRCSVNGANAEKIIESVGLVEGLAIDWSGQNVYWTDSASGRLEVARLDGSSRRALIWQGLKKPKSIVLDPRKGFMYWSELASKVIKRAAMDGSSPTVFMEQVGRVHSLAIDYDTRALYWAALDQPVIEFVYLNGTGRKVIVEDVPMPYALTIFNERVFWGDWNTGKIEAAWKVDGSNRRTVHGKLDYISELKVFHGARSAGAGGCSVDNGGCAHLCLAKPSRFRCGCPAHFRLNADNATCKEPEEFMLYAQKNAIGRLVNTNTECSDAPVPLTGLKSVRAIEFDPVKQHFYWMDDESHAIRRVPISFSSTSATDGVVVVNPTRPLHMVLDVLGRALYWTCAGADSINATSIEGNFSQGVILQGENMRPRHLAFHQTKRYLIWNDIGLAAIMRSNVDGLARVQLAKAANATALAVDDSTDTVYWAVNKQIHSVDIDGRNQMVVWQGGWAPLALSVCGGAAFVSGAERALMRLPLHRRNAPATPVPHVGRLLALQTTRKVSTSHPCYGGGACGGAAGACGAYGACGCGVHCAPPSPKEHLCQHNQFLCRAPTPHCIPNDWKCDGQKDCADGSDEGGQCACAGGVRCVDGSCAAALALCAHGAFCPHHPLPDAFRCDDRLCLPASLLCDGRQHCEDGSDEAPAADCYPPKPSTGGWGALGAVVCAGCVGAAGALWRALRRRNTHPPALLPLQPTKPPTTIESSESYSGRYPPTNPPPSPATSGGRRRAYSYRHYRSINRPPPPTPASTDAAESEPEPGAPPPSPACLRPY